MEQENIRNFCIIAHIDHGKSTLADRLLEITGTIEKRKMREQVLDQMDLERERGITIKLQPVRMTYKIPNNKSQIPNGAPRLADSAIVAPMATTAGKPWYPIPAFVHPPRADGTAAGLSASDLARNPPKPDDVLPSRASPVPPFNHGQARGIRAEADKFQNSNSKLGFGAWDLGFADSVYQLNLIDTPGHVDFSYEVSRSLAACEGAILVVDATQGIQAQTLANVNLAREHNLVIIPVVNKIDLPNADPERTASEIRELINQHATVARPFMGSEILFVSAKTGQNVEQILEKVIEKIPAPAGDKLAPLQALIFDSKYDKHRGVVAYVRVVNGRINAGKKIRIIATGAEAQSIEVGYFDPEFHKTDSLSAGEVGYIVTGLREVNKVRVGDTITLANKNSPHPLFAKEGAKGEFHEIKALPGYKEVKPMVFASLFPASGDDYGKLRDALEKLKLNDASLTFEPENIASLGFGFRTGFLGLLHMDIVQERLSREFGLDLVLTSPSVAYVVKKRTPHPCSLSPKGGEGRGEEEGSLIYSPSALPDPSEMESILEPWVRLDILTPEKSLGAVMHLVTTRRGVFRNSNYLGPGRLKLHFEIPLANIISDFYDKLKSVSSGYASMNYELLDYRIADLVKVDILVAGERVDALSFISYRDFAESEGRDTVEKLKALIPKQQFPVALQAAIGGKIIARETIPALRKDVTAKLYGGDVTRKMKLLKKQKKGKKRLKSFGRVEIPQEAFLALLKR